MGDSKKTDYRVTAIVVVLIAGVFVSDLMTPLGVVDWILYVLPIGLACWMSLRWMPFLLAGACTVLILLGYFFSPPGISAQLAIVNRAIGIVALWTMAFFLTRGRV